MYFRVGACIVVFICFAAGQLRAADAPLLYSDSKPQRYDLTARATAGSPRATTGALPANARSARAAGAHAAGACAARACDGDASGTSGFHQAAGADHNASHAAVAAGA